MDSVKQGSILFSRPLGGVALSAFFIVVLFACAPSTEQKDAFTAGRTLVTEGRYESALEALEVYLDRWPDGEFACRAWLFVAKAHLARGDFEQARAALETCVRDFPDSLEAHKCRYKLAVLDLLEGDPAAARLRFEDLRSHPDGPLAAEAAAFARFLGDRATTAAAAPDSIPQ